jgi:hypothetical protein
MNPNPTGVRRIKAHASEERASAPPQVVDAIGWGQWFRYASGAADTLGALLIFFPRWTSYGALIITCTVGLGTYLCFTLPLYNPIFPLVMTLLAATLAGLAWRSKPAVSAP